MKTEARICVSSAFTLIFAPSGISDFKVPVGRGRMLQPSFEKKASASNKLHQGSKFGSTFLAFVAY